MWEPTPLEHEQCSTEPNLITHANDDKRHGTQDLRTMALASAVPFINIGETAKLKWITKAQICCCGPMMVVLRLLSVLDGAVSYCCVFAVHLTPCHNSFKDQKN